MDVEAPVSQGARPRHIDGYAARSAKQRHGMHGVHNPSDLRRAALAIDQAALARRARRTARLTMRVAELSSSTAMTSILFMKKL